MERNETRESAVGADADRLRTGPRPRRTSTTTAASVRFLSDAASYPEPTAAVAVCETHMAYVFLTDHFAYKLKKPVRYEFLDFSTVAQRKYVCEEEVRLNRRLAPDVYLGTVPLLRDHSGVLRLGGAPTAGSATVDWLVQMRRLPRERMLDEVIRTGGPTNDEVRTLGALLVSFYRNAPPEPTLPQVYLDRLQHDVDADVRALMDHAAQLPVDRIRSLENWLTARLREQAQMFRARAEQARIVEAHGDLRPEHICLTSPPVIIDCLEFRRDFRLLDPADELAFLALECEGLGAPAVGQTLLQLYEEGTADTLPQAVVEFHMCARAVLRAKIAIWHLRDGTAVAAGRWIAAARHYLELAARHTR